MRRLLYWDVVGLVGSAGLLPLRVVMGVAFILHGWPKVQNPLEWMGPEAPVPGVMQLAAAVAEFLGGVMLIPGFLTKVAALGIGGTMVGAIQYHVQKGDAFVAPGGPSYELAAVYLACAVLFLVVGPGRLSLDDLLFRTRPKA